MGRTLTAASIMGLDLKDEKETVSVQIDGDGPVGAIVTVADRRGDVRGYIENPYVDLPLKNGKLDVSQAVGSRVSDSCSQFRNERALYRQG